MTDRSPCLDLPYLQPAQAQKHVTHNEALEGLDAIVQLSVLAFDATLPPGAPSPGDRYALGAGAIGAWAGQPQGTIARWAEPAWLFVPPAAGWQAWGVAEGALRVFRDGAWQRPELSDLGINTSADATNRLAVAAPASLFTHEGDDHRLKINKSADTDTASVLFQSGWTGHAEMGLAGGTGWTLKVSPDGSSWTEALSIDPASGHAGGAAVQAAPDDTTPGRLMRADYGYGPGNLLGPVSQNGGLPTGAVIEQGSNGNGYYLRLADGTQICWHTQVFAGVDIAIPTGGAYRSELFSVDFPMAFADTPTVTLTGTRTDGSWDVWDVLSAVTASQFTALHMKLAADTSQGRSLGYTAFGRWV